MLRPERMLGFPFPFAEQASSNPSPFEGGISGPLHCLCERRTIHIDERSLSTLEIVDDMA